MEWILFWVGVNFLIGYLIGKPKDQAFASALICVLLGPIGWIIALCSSGLTRRCPHCAEVVKLDAKVCRYCGRDLAVVAPKGIAPPQLSEKYNLPQTKPTSSLGIFLAIVAAILVAAIIIGVFGSIKNAADRAAKLRDDIDRLTRNSRSSYDPDLFHIHGASPKPEPLPFSEAIPSPNAPPVPTANAKIARSSPPSPEYVFTKREVTIAHGVSKITVPKGTKLQVISRGSGGVVQVRIGKYSEILSSEDFQ
ncbi:MAG: zinc-ribbon domain [Verrucomicrobiota bacterium]|jgi:hypothetical protein